MERIELSSGRWQRPILPLNYTRIKIQDNAQIRGCRNTKIGSLVLGWETVQSFLL